VDDDVAAPAPLQAVEAALAQLDGCAELPAADQVPVYESVHRVLHAALSGDGQGG
jgi:hypothetical protein